MACATTNCDPPSADSRVPTTNTGGSSKLYLPYLLLISGLGGLLAGVDFGIIATAILYLNKTISLTEGQLSFVVAIYTGGCMVAALLAGMLADWVGRKKIMIAGGAMFVGSILLIYTSQGFMPLLLGRILMGLSGGVICVVVPLYMAECLSSNIRGRGTAIFQFMLTFGIVMAGLIGVVFTRRHDVAIAAAGGDLARIFAADDAAWRNMFLVAAIPGVFYTLGAFFIRESPRWLFLRHRATEAEAVLRLSRSEEQTRFEMSEMGAHSDRREGGGLMDLVRSLAQRKYVMPFVIACIVLACTQATGINSILAYAVVILKQAGLNDVQASQGNTLITVLNCAMTIVGAALVDRVGRKFLLKTGTGGIIVALLAGAFLYRHFESQRVDVDAVVTRQISADGQSLSIRVDEATLGRLPGGQAAQLNVLYRYDDGQGHKRQGVATAFSNASDESARLLVIKPKTDDKGRVIDSGKLIIERAKYGPIPSATAGWLITGMLCRFIASFSVGPGVCVWLALTELMPTRIRSMGMGIAMLLNSGVSFLIALVFLPTVGYYGYSAMFFFWAGCTVVYFITAAFFMPETKGKTLEEIEDYFEGKKPKAEA